MYPFSFYMKRIIACSDGTWNAPGTTDRGKPVSTNVEKMFNCICREDKDGTRQVKAYDQGVGTGYSTVDHLVGGATGAGIDKNIKDIYTFLTLNYEEGDQIYLFGFSRGAYTARSVAGLIRTCGLLKPQHILLTERAYNLYRDRNSYSTPSSDLMQAFRRNYSFEAHVHFIGVWDTVGSLGIPLSFFQIRNKKRYQFHDQTLSSTVRYAYHALAIDERRALFTPTLWEKSDTVKNDPSHPQQMEQRWFAGVHSNIGGGYADCGLSDLALQWLIDKAGDTGLCYDTEQLKAIQPNCNGELRNSYNSFYRFWAPHIRAINLNDNTTNQTIDASVWARIKQDKDYLPKALKGFTPPPK